MGLILPCTDFKVYVVEVEAHQPEEVMEAYALTLLTGSISIPMSHLITVANGPQPDQKHQADNTVSEPRTGTVSPVDPLSNSDFPTLSYI